MLNQLLFPFLRNPDQPYKATGKLSGRRRHAVGIIGKVRRQQDGITEIVGVPYRPHGRFQRIDNIATGADLVAGFFLYIHQR